MGNDNLEMSLPAINTNETAVSYVQSMAAASIQSAFVIAKKFPRNTDKARINILSDCRRSHFAASVCYNKPTGGGKTVSDLSIRAAEVAANGWGNIRTDVIMLLEDEDKRVYSILAMDLETNATYTNIVVVRKSVERASCPDWRTKLGERKNSYGKKVFIVIPTDDEFEMECAKEISKKMRNCILRLIPEHIKAEMKEAARETVLKGIKPDDDSYKKKVLDAFATLRVMPDDLENYLGKTVDKCSPAEIADLQDIYSTIKDGQARWEDYISDANEKKKKTENTAVMNDDDFGNPTEGVNDPKDKHPHEEPARSDLKENKELKKEKKEYPPAKQQEESRPHETKKASPATKPKDDKRERVAKILTDPTFEKEVRKILTETMVEGANIDMMMQQDPMNKGAYNDALIGTLDIVLEKEGFYKGYK